MDFQGRATCGLNMISYESCDDNQSHGTHVAGTVGGRRYGVAKGVSLIDVKVLDATGSGEWSSLISALEYVIEQKKESPETPMVINMSLGGAVIIPEFKDIIDDAVAAGIVVVVAAGNDSIDACEFSPAFVPRAITVGASDWDDKPADFSNFGRCVDLYAPGVSINSAYFLFDMSIAYDGTSMAAPHVAGVAALYLEAHPTWTSAQVWNAMKKDAVGGRIQVTLDFFQMNTYFRKRRTTDLLLQAQHVD